MGERKAHDDESVVVATEAEPFLRAALIVPKEN
jgi:hypothetical protein